MIKRIKNVIKTVIFVSMFVECLYYENFDLQNIYTPVKATILRQLLIQYNYDLNETDFLYDGFTNGFDLGYRGPQHVKRTAPNLKLNVGNEVMLWNKVMKEVQAKRYAGPFTKIPYEHYIQSPIGLVSKVGGDGTRLIFHLSYPRLNLESGQKKGDIPQKSVNGNTPESLCSVSYPDIADAIELCLQAGKDCAMGKSDLKSAFRHLAIKMIYWKYLVMKAKYPKDNKFYYFIDKCLPFGAAISCAIFQRFSNALSFLVKQITGRHNVNYLDDYFFRSSLQSDL